jgi:hypothetical protein
MTDLYNFMGMPRYMSYGENNYRAVRPQEHAKAMQSLDVRRQKQRELHFGRIWPQYSKGLYILARTYDAKDPLNVQAMQAFLESLFQLIPNETYRQRLVDFYTLQPYVVNAVVRAVPSLFLTYSWLEPRMRQSQSQLTFVQMALANQDEMMMFLWVYLLDAFIQVQMAEDSNRTKLQQSLLTFPSFHEQQIVYQLDRISKNDWGNALWFILHTTSLYAPQPVEKSFVLYKTLVNSLQYLLPCPKCRSHLTNNLQYINFESCPKTNEELFKCSWQLHNVVNKSESKPVVGLQEAFAFYTY